METRTFDTLTSRVARTSTRRGALRFLAAAALGGASLGLMRQDDAAAKRKRKKSKGSGGTGGTVPSAPAQGLRQICAPSTDTCGAGLHCGAPTTRHTCSSTVEDVTTWCCVPEGAVCAGECDCCGNF